MSTKTNIEKLIGQYQWAKDALDDLVHDEAQRLASRVNNEGLKEQLDFIEEQGRLTEEEVLKEIEAAVPL